MNDDPVIKANLENTEFSLAKMFQTATDQLAYIKSLENTFDLRQLEVMVANGILTEQQISIMLNNSRIQSSGGSTKEEKRRNERVMTDILLDQLRDRLDDLQALMEERLKVLREKYGDDVVGGMAAAYLNEDELSGLETDEQKLQALADKFLDENGGVKEEYAHLEEALYARDWNEAERLKPIVAKYNGKDKLTPEEKDEIIAHVNSSTLADNENNMSLSNNDEYQRTVDEQLDRNQGVHETGNHSTNFKFM